MKEVRPRSARLSAKHSAALRKNILGPPKPVGAAVNLLRNSAAITVFPMPAAPSCECGELNGNLCDYARSSSLFSMCTIHFRGSVNSTTTGRFGDTLSSGFRMIFLIVPCVPALIVIPSG